jgi:hypothetical protein
METQCRLVQMHGLYGDKRNRNRAGDAANPRRQRPQLDGPVTDFGFIENIDIDVDYYARDSPLDGSSSLR